MSGKGTPEATPDGHGLNIVIVASSWHERIMGGLIDGAQKALYTAGATSSLVRVAGAFELPVACKAVLAGDADAVVALGTIIRGQTPHFDYVCQAATAGLTQVALETNKAVGFGVLTLDDEKQGLDRAGFPESRGDKGRDAAEAAMATARLLRALRSA